MLKISGPFGAAFVTAILLSGAGAGFAIDSARADACMAAPKTAAPAGQHWYFRINRASRRKCWYLHAAAPLRRRAVTRHHAAVVANAESSPKRQIAAAPSVAATPPVAAAPPVASPNPSVSTPASAAVNNAPAPHITVLAVRTATPFVSTTPIPQQGALPQNTPEKAPAPQMLPRDDVAPATEGAKPAGDAAQPQGKADAAYDAAAQTADAANAATRTRTAEMFILLALVFGVAAALIALVSKIADVYRKPRISAGPDAARLNYRSVQRSGGEAGFDEPDIPFVDPQEHYGLTDLHAQEWLDTPTPAPDGSSAPPLRNENFVRSQSPKPSPTDIEPALRILRQARQSRVA